MTQTWFITGANRGLGLEIARSILAAGHNVVATARKPDAIEVALGEHSNLLAVKLDVTNLDDASEAVAAAETRFGGIDVLVNNAGYGQLGWFENTSDEKIRAQFETNVFGAMHVTRAVLPLMRKKRLGHVFTISSVAGIFAPAGGSIYSASKFAVEGWMEGLTEELKPLGIKATIIEPGFFKTDFLDASSVIYGDYDIADYSEAARAFEEWHHNMNHQQVGDPAKLGAVLMELNKIDNPLVRFAAGSDASGIVLKKAESIRADAEHFKALSASTDG
ncbi:SDR family NAD(P)-dependent oxidoreductase [Rhizobium leguminosarum]|uniref:SDR family NAD(P)-dependent oxidoreductase n=1 Tax=Rhizobium leguminosarum TaxID=384 RepID=UPI001C911EEB|nr:SDR family NAD(P)-dependent oxidoreductase [Rhizobium leguminosarum]MBY2927037.1 SDR family NAD(P)-dependent oxidoreductase [Rhizobium leguminosarum]